MGPDTCSTDVVFENVRSTKRSGVRSRALSLHPSLFYIYHSSLLYVYHSSLLYYGLSNAGVLHSSTPTTAQPHPHDAGSDALYLF